jgi:hypothetical protein
MCKGASSDCVVREEVMQVTLSVYVMKRLGAEAKGDNPKVELACRQHNHLLDEDAVAVVHHTALRPNGAQEQARQERVRRDEDGFDLLLVDLHLCADYSQPLHHSLSFSSNAGVKQGGADLVIVRHLQPSGREPIELDLRRPKLLGLVGTERMGGGVVCNGTYCWKRACLRKRCRSSSTNSGNVILWRSPILRFARNLLERFSQIGRRSCPH